MFIKLAQLEGSESNIALSKCCEHNKTEFIPISKNCFGIFTATYTMAFGREDIISPPRVGLKAMIETYKSAAAIDLGYSSYYPDDSFFARVLAYCNRYESNMVLESIEILSGYGTEHILTEPDEIEDAIEGRENTVLKMNLYLEWVSIIVNNLGYIDIGSRYPFYAENKRTIVEMLKAGVG